MSLALFFAQHASNASTFIFRSLRLCVGILLWFDVCWRYSVVRLGWYGIVMQDCSGSMRVGVTVWFGWGDVVSLRRTALVRCVLALRCGSAWVMWYRYAGLLWFDVCWRYGVVRLG